MVHCKLLSLSSYLYIYRYILKSLNAGDILMNICIHTTEFPIEVPFVNESLAAHLVRTRFVFI